jgi:hypothetical protein
MEQPPNFAGRVTKITLEQPKTYFLPDWDKYNDVKKLEILRQIVLQYGRDPRITELAVSILRDNECKPREYKKQAECLLKWVQNNVYYVNEPLERLQSPMYTLKTMMGDCDDLAILLCSFFECIRLPWRFVLSANTSSGLVRYIEQDANYRKLQYSHIYCAVGNRPFKPTEWIYCEPTMKVPLGWDIVQTQNDSNARKYLPELSGIDGIRPTSASAGGAVGASVESNEEFNIKKFTKDIVVAVIAGSLTAIGTEIMLDYIKSGIWYQTYILRKGKK